MPVKDLCYDNRGELSGQELWNEGHGVALTQTRHIRARQCLLWRYDGGDLRLGIGSVMIRASTPRTSLL